MDQGRRKGGCVLTGRWAPDMSVDVAFQMDTRCIGLLWIDCTVQYRTPRTPIESCIAL